MDEDDRVVMTPKVENALERARMAAKISDLQYWDGSEIHVFHALSRLLVKGRSLLCETRAHLSRLERRDRYGCFVIIAFRMAGAERITEKLMWSPADSAKAGVASARVARGFTFAARISMPFTVTCTSAV